jgi:UDP-glucuronate decarboxylase
LRKIDNKIIITGASGWLGIELISFLHKNFGDSVLENIYPISSSLEFLDFDFAKVKCYKINELENIDNAILYHFAFIAKDRVSSFDDQGYINANLDIRNSIKSLIEKNDIKSMLYSSSGAVYKRGTDEIIENDNDLYGYCKVLDEEFFKELCNQHNIKLLIPRIFSILGKFINKNGVFAVKDMILQAKNSGIIKINAKAKTYRNYINICDIYKIADCFFSDKNSDKYYVFDTFGATIEMQELANLIFETVKIKSNIDRNFDYTLPSDNYFGNQAKQNYLLEKYNLSLYSIKESLYAMI